MIDEIAKYKLASELFNAHFKDFNRMSVEDVKDTAYKTAVDCVQISKIVFDAFSKAVEDHMPELTEAIKDTADTIDITKLNNEDKPLN